MNCSSALVNKKKKRKKSYSKGKTSLSLEEFGMMEINIAGYIERHSSDLSQIKKWATVQIDVCIVEIVECAYIRCILCMYVSYTYLYNNLYLHNHLSHCAQQSVPSSCSRNTCEMNEFKCWIKCPVPLLPHPLYACDDSVVERHILYIIGT